MVASLAKFITLANLECKKNAESFSWKFRFARGLPTGVFTVPEECGIRGRPLREGAVVMTRETFDLHGTAAVPEKAPASASPPDNLSPGETELYLHLQACDLAPYLVSNYSRTIRSHQWKCRKMTT